MIQNSSPWIKQLNRTRPIEGVREDLKTDVVVIGGGIAGISTAFFALKNTDKKIILLEANKVAHGATGHNAGQVTSAFERPFDELVEEFGPKLASEGQGFVDGAWALLDEMYTEAGLDIPFVRIPGKGGLSSKDQVISYLEDELARKKVDLPINEIYLADNAGFLAEIDDKYKELYTTVPHKEVLDMLETECEDFVAVIVTAQKGVINSALFTEEVAKFLLEKYADRFKIFENTLVSKIVLHENETILDTGNHTVTASKTILCTNGFETIRIFNKNGLDIDTSFHHSLIGTVGYMSGYLEEMSKPPAVFYYHTDANATVADPYFYLTRRMYEYNENKHNLVSVGGPEVNLDDMREYERDREYPEHAKEEINTFVRKVYETHKDKDIEYIFTWHGLMGYTRNKVRLIGEEPRNPILLYNLGCNGIGILPSIYGGKRISQILNEEDLSPSIFDPQNQSK